MLHDYRKPFTPRKDKNVVVGQCKSIFQLQLQFGLYGRYIQTSRNPAQITKNPQSSLGSAELQCHYR